MQRLGAPIVLALTLLAAGVASAADRQILGRKLFVKDVAGVEPGRVVIGLGRETATDIPALVGDPTSTGATLHVVANGAAASNETYALPAAGWTATATGFRYAGPIAGEPVRRVLLRRTEGGLALLKAVLKGSVGTNDLDVVPPNPGDDGGLVLEITAGDRYCVSFGNAAGGTELEDTGTQWKLLNATSESGCAATTVTSTSLGPTVTTTTSSTTIPPPSFCTDTDGGINRAVKGTTTNDYLTRTDTCYDPYVGPVPSCDPTKADPQPAPGNYCALEEFYCGSDNRVFLDLNYFACTNGCANGTCVP